MLTNEKTKGENEPGIALPLSGVIHTAVFVSGLLKCSLECCPFLKIQFSFVFCTNLGCSFVKVHMDPFHRFLWLGVNDYDCRPTSATLSYFHKLYVPMSYCGRGKQFRICLVSPTSTDHYI